MTTADDRRACEGAVTIPERMGPEHCQECIACGQRVRDDMTEHPFFGFTSACPERSR
jgi:DnaJ-class molecular chaperone